MPAWSVRGIFEDPLHWLARFVVLTDYDVDKKGNDVDEEENDVDEEENDVGEEEDDVDEEEDDVDEEKDGVDEGMTRLKNCILSCRSLFGSGKCVSPIFWPAAFLTLLF
jgi:hypothetical protein